MEVSILERTSLTFLEYHRDRIITLPKIIQKSSRGVIEIALVELKMISRSREVIETIPSLMLPI